MGVIDLDARVKKLEQDGGGLASVVDQIDSDLTALDEQINGDGETDFGLAGDVAELQTTTRTELTIVSPYQQESDSGDSCVLRNGNVVSVHISVKGLTANTSAVVTTIPETLRPSTYVYQLGVSGDFTTYAIAAINPDNGQVTIESKGTQAHCDLTYCLYSTS